MITESTIKLFVLWGKENVLQKKVGHLPSTF